MHRGLAEFITIEAGRGRVKLLSLTPAGEDGPAGVVGEGKVADN
jgi:hypothetical protein